MLPTPTAAALSTAAANGRSVLLDMTSPLTPPGRGRLAGSRVYLTLSVCAIVVGWTRHTSL
jgi:hypothetical protein